MRKKPGINSPKIIGQGTPLSFISTARRTWGVAFRPGLRRVVIEDLSRRLTRSAVALSSSPCVARICLAHWLTALRRSPGRAEAPRLREPVGLDCTLSVALSTQQLD